MSFESIFFVDLKRFSEFSVSLLKNIERPDGPDESCRFCGNFGTLVPPPLCSKNAASISLPMTASPPTHSPVRPGSEILMAVATETALW